MRKRQFKYRPYTMVEILLVLAISLLLVGLGSSAISAMTGKRGLNGAAMIVSSQVNLARSVAVSQNRYVALLIPEPFSGKTTSSKSLLKPFFCNRMRLCFVKKTTTAGKFDFDGWIEGYDWVQLPTKTCAHPVFGYDLATLDKNNRISMMVDVITKPKIFESPDIDECSGIVFAPTGRLASYGAAMIQIYNALPNADPDDTGKPDMRDLKITGSPTLQSDDADDVSELGNLPYRRWCVSINKFTGRTEVTYAQPPEK